MNQYYLIVSLFLITFVEKNLLKKTIMNFFIEKKVQFNKLSIERCVQKQNKILKKMYAPLIEFRLERIPEELRIVQLIV